ncbi:MAG TPA: glycosyltransferase [Terracidiphilus sp.]|nr:glycosyltransferase [Terracidiphilus sp.]
MRIAYMLTSLGMGGAEKQVIALAECMQTRGHAVMFLVLRERQAHEWPTRLEVVHLDMRRSMGSAIQGLMRARHVLGAFRPDLLHSHTYPANMMGRMLRLMGAAPPVLSTIHNVYEGNSLRMLAYRMTDSLAARTTAVSEAVARRFVETKAVAQHKCVVIRNAIDLAEFTPDSARREKLRGPISADDFVWLAAGRNVEAKDFPNLLAAFEKVWASHPNTLLWIAGDRATDGSGHKKAFATALPHGTVDRVRFLGLRRDMPALLDAADGFVLSSAWEGMPLVVGEAMAMEKPVVATDVGGVRELMGATGTLVPARDSERLGEGMITIMQETKQARVRMGRAARKRIVEEFDFEKRANEWEESYRELLAPAGGSDVST